MLQAGHSDVVLVDTMDEMPSLADVQLAHLKLRALCLPGENNLGALNPNLVYSFVHCRSFSPVSFHFSIPSSLPTDLLMTCFPHCVLLLFFEVDYKNMPSLTNEDSLRLCHVMAYLWGES